MFNFEPKTHTYTIDGKKLTGVTTVIGVVAKGDGLIQWSANCAVEYVQKALDSLSNGSVIDWSVVLEEAKKAWVTNRDSAGSKGKDVHEIIEGIIKRAIASDGYIGPIEAHQYFNHPQVSQFINWAHENNIKFLLSEEPIYSKELWCGGTVDFVYEKNGEIYVGDVKTAKVIYPTNFWQTSAYKLMLEEMGLYRDIKGFTIVRLGKDGGFEVQSNYAYEDNISGFLSALNIYRKLNAITPPKKVYKRKLTTK